MKELFIFLRVIDGGSLSFDEDCLFESQTIEVESIAEIEVRAVVQTMFEDWGRWLLEMLFYSLLQWSNGTPDTSHTSLRERILPLIKSIYSSLQQEPHTSSGPFSVESSITMPHKKLSIIQRFVSPKKQCLCHRLQEVSTAIHLELLVGSLEYLHCRENEEKNSNGCCKLYVLIRIYDYVLCIANSSMDG